MTSRLCTYKDFQTVWFRDYLVAAGRGFTLHRKHWELAAIYEALRESCVLQDGRRGIGFGVGTEDLPALFAARGARVLATDQEPTEEAVERWEESGQLCSGLEALNERGLCRQADFDRLVSFQNMDMNDADEWFKLNGQFDFCWSACALDHLGTLEKGIDFILHTLLLIKPGGMVVHTTEFNVSSDYETAEEAPTVFYRRRDLEKLRDNVVHAGFEMEPIDYDYGDTHLDYHVDREPHRQDCHLKIEASGCVATSVVLIIRRPLPKPLT